MRRFFAGLAALQMLAVVTQFFLAASGAFDTAPNDESNRTARWAAELSCSRSWWPSSPRQPGCPGGSSG